MGYHVRAAGTIAAAKEAIDPTVDAIILDLMLPDGDGAEILKQVRSAGLKTRVCVTTGVSSPAWLERIDNLRPDCMLRKPIDLSDLLAQLQ